MTTTHRRCTLLVAGALLLSVAAVGCGGDGDGSRAGSVLSVDFTPTPGTDVAADEVRADLVAAIDHVVAAPFVSIESVGYTEDRRSDITASVDVAGWRMSTREVISDGIEVGAPVSETPLVSEVVLVGDDAWLRVLQPGDDTTPFQFIDATGLSEQFLPAAYTQLGRVFDSLSQLSQLVATSPFEAARLGNRTIDGVETVGVRVTFDTEVVADFLADNGFAAVGDPHDLEGETVFELWYDDSGVRELVATGLQFQDGEALETSARIVYRIEDAVQIEAPSNTVAG